MNSLRVSSQAMKKAGIGVGVSEAEKVMNELDDQIREASEVTTVFATPIANPLVCDPVGLGDDDIADIDAELGLIADEDPFSPVSTAATLLVPPMSASSILEHSIDVRPVSVVLRAPVLESASGSRALAQEQPAARTRVAPVPIQLSNAGSRASAQSLESSAGSRASAQSLESSTGSRASAQSLESNAGSHASAQSPGELTAIRRVPELVSILEEPVSVADF
jgi:hypothetical protein